VAACRTVSGESGTHGSDENTTHPVSSMSTKEDCTGPISLGRLSLSADEIVSVSPSKSAGSNRATEGFTESAVQPDRGLAPFVSSEYSAQRDFHNGEFWA
jgi:hypothetical protein